MAPVEEEEHPTARANLKRKSSSSSSNGLASFLTTRKKAKTGTCLKERKNDPDSPTKAKSAKANSGKLKQLHLSFATSLRTCVLCQLTYTCGAPDDEILHRSHCARVTKGMEWGRDEVKAEGTDVEVVKDEVKLTCGGKARIVSFSANIGGKVGGKVRCFVLLHARLLT